ncbi:MAG: PAS domain S-box protein [Methanospirillaceae archaeon]|nr:PAS domain S-box protein [Methanospirillaceae archaeon]
MNDHPDLPGTILVVDDTPASISMVRAALKEAGYHVLVATSGEKALQSVNIEKPDLILLDILMPGMDGYETCRRLKENAATRDIPVLFLSALAETFDKVKSFELGAVDYLIKPIAQEEMLARVRTHISVNRLEKALQIANEELEARVEQRTADLAVANVQLREEIAERRRAELEISKKKDELFKAYEELTAFGEELKANYDELSRTEKELRDSEERYRTVFENTGTATAIIEADYTISLANTRFEQLSGFLISELEGKKNLNEFIRTTDQKTITEQHQLLDENNKKTDSQYECRFDSKRGTVHSVILTIRGIPDTTRSVASLMDITERIHAEEALQKSEKKYRTLIELAQEGIWALDKAYTTTYVNPKLAEMLGSTQEEMTGREIFSFLPEGSHRKECLTSLQHILQGIRAELECSLNKKNGEIMYASLSAGPIEDENGQLMGTLAVVMDITEKKKLQEKEKMALRQIEENVYQMAVLNDEIRNPLCIISVLCEEDNPPHYKDIIDQVNRIDNIVNEVDKGYVTSLKIRDFLREYHNIVIEDLAGDRG